MEKGSKIYVAGHSGMIGSILLQKLRDLGFSNITTRGRESLDLLDQNAVRSFLSEEKPEYLFLLAAKVSNIQAYKSYPADFLYENTMIAYNIIWNAHLVGVKKLLFVGSASVYPQKCDQPIKEECLLQSYVDPSAEGYSLAKISGVKLCEKIFTQYSQDFISCLPTNVYGPDDRFDDKTGQVIPSLITRMHNSKINGIEKVDIWGTGNAVREFIYIDDLADALIFLMQKYDKNQVINVGTGKGCSIAELAQAVKKVVGYQGSLLFDTSKPEGPPKRVLDNTKLKVLGFKCRTELEDGLQKVYSAYLEKRIK